MPEICLYRFFFFSGNGSLLFLSVKKRQVIFFEFPYFFSHGVFLGCVFVYLYEKISFFYFMSLLRVAKKIIFIKNVFIFTFFCVVALKL